MFADLLSPAFVPFTFALALFLALLVLELLLSVVGGSLLAGGDGADLDLDLADPGGMAVGDLPDLGDVDLGDVDLGEFEVDLDADVTPSAVAPSGVLHWVGLAKVPFMIWLASVLVGFGLSGLILQSVATSVLGGALPGVVAVPVAAAVGFVFVRSFGRVFARLLPKTETEALSEQSFGRRRGVVTQGTAARGRPAEVRVTDRFGNAHYLRAEPLRDTAHIPQGAEVLVLRHRGDRGYRIVDLSQPSSST